MRSTRKEVSNHRFKSLSKLITINQTRRRRSLGALTFSRKIKSKIHQSNLLLLWKRSRKSQTTQRKQSSMLSRSLQPCQIHTCASSIPKSASLSRAFSICSSGTTPRTLSKSSIQANRLQIFKYHHGRSHRLMKTLMITSQQSKCEPSKPCLQSIAPSSNRLQRSRHTGQLRIRTLASR